MSFNLQCLFGLHKWGEWEYESPDKCVQVRFCQRDGAKRSGTRIQHDWGKWEYKAPGSCVQVKKCLRDGSIAPDTQILHDWDEWEPHNGCKQTRICKRDKKKEARTQHEWGNWSYTHESFCDRARTCLKCGEMETDKQHAYQEVSSETWDEDYEEKISGQSYDRNTRVTTVTYTQVIEECARCHDKKTTCFSTQ